MGAQQMLLLSQPTESVITVDSMVTPQVHHQVSSSLILCSFLIYSSWLCWAPHCCVRGLPFVSVLWLPVVLGRMGLVTAQLWDQIGTGIEPVSPALVGRFLTTGPQGSPHFVQSFMLGPFLPTYHHRRTLSLFSTDVDTSFPTLPYNSTPRGAPKGWVMVCPHLPGKTFEAHKQITSLLEKV